MEKEIKNLVESKIKDLEVNVIEGVVHIDFDDIGTLWTEVFEEVFKREMNDHIGQDVDDFEEIQNVSLEILSNNGEFEIEYDNYM